jgi:hypothetical protein
VKIPRSGNIDNFVLKRKKMKILKAAIICFNILYLLSTTVSAQDSIAKVESRLQFNISFPSHAHPEKITGRAFVIISKTDKREPRFQTGYTGVPFWGENIYALKPGEEVVIDEGVFGFSLKSIKDIPPGEYFVQGFINIYTKFKRSDGHTLWLHNDQWEGQQWNRSPGKLHIYTGTMDSFYLNDAVVLLEEFLESTDELYYEGIVEYGEREPHCWGPRGTELYKLISEHTQKNALRSENISTWKY